MDNVEILAGRELGETLPLSIGTAVAFEALQTNGFENHYRLYVNLTTLFRNMHGTVEVEYRDNIKPKEYAISLSEEMQQIVKFVSEFSKGLGTVVFYCPTYRNLQKDFPKAKHRIPTTQKQEIYKHLSDEVMGIFLKHPELLEQQTGLRVEATDCEPPRIDAAAMIITHHPVDLLSCRADTLLLESHTGTLKPYSKWYTKLNGGKELLRIPFNRLTLQVFGDGVDFGTNSATKKVVLQLAEERKWTPLTSMERIRYSLDQMRDTFSAGVLKEML